MPEQTFLGRFYYTADAGSNDIVIDSTINIDLTSGYYYTSGYSGESGNSLIGHIESVIRAHPDLDGLGGNDDETDMDMFYTPSTGKVSFAFNNSHTMTIASNLALILGFSTTPGTAQNFSSTLACRYVWQPGQGAASHDVDYKQFWSPQSQTVYCRSASGACYSVVGTELFANELEYRLLDQSLVITPTSGTVYADFQQWYVDVLHAGQPFRVLTDSSLVQSYYASDEYVTAIYGERNSFGANKLPDFIDFANRHIENYQNFWDVKIPMVKYVDPS